MSETRRLLEDATERAASYLEGLESRAVAPSRDAVAALAALDRPIPERSNAPDVTLRVLDEIGSPATMAMTGGRFFGFVIGGTLPAALAAHWLAGAWDQNTVFQAITPGTAHFERVALRWLRDLFGLADECGGAFVTGATVANFAALAAARHRILERVGWNVESDGLFGAPPITVVVGAEVHPTVIKALGLLGLGRRRVLEVPVDSQGRMRPDALPALPAPAIVCAQAGNVNTGAFDPLEELCEAAHEAGAWVHVDGAFGLWAAAVPSLAPLARGVARADSWATDCHKWLNVPCDSGVAIVRDREAARAAMSVAAEYFPSGEAERNPSDYTPELSRRARGVEAWAALHSLGRAGLVDLIERTCRHARRFAEGLRSRGYAILNDVVLNQVLVTFGDAETTRRVVSEIQADGTCWCGDTVWQGRRAMRISVSSWATTDEDVERSLEAMIRIAERVHRARAT